MTIMIVLAVLLFDTCIAACAFMAAFGYLATDKEVTRISIITCIFTAITQAVVLAISLDGM